MHERTLVVTLLREIQQLIERHSAPRASQVHVTVGEFSGIEPELLRSAFEELSADTTARGAHLRLDVVPLTARCDACGNVFPVRQFHFHCTACGHPHTSVVRGQELLLESVTMEADVS
jgi:hydrogenase nickel incorporation protein HypA/HybF